jgi:hypothetical protein
MSGHRLLGLNGAIDVPWPEGLPDFRRSPQLASLGALHATASIAMYALYIAHPNLTDDKKSRSRNARLDAAVNGLVDLLDTLFVLLERYYEELKTTMERSGGARSNPPLLDYEWLSEDEAAAVHEVLRTVARSVGSSLPEYFEDLDPPVEPDDRSNSENDDIPF